MRFILSLLLISSIVLADNGYQDIPISSGGSTGTTGKTGATGGTGATGQTGAGSTGASGLTGASGASGASGSTGASGLTGASGASGVSGATGATGSTPDLASPGPIGSTTPSTGSFTTVGHAAGSVGAPSIFFTGDTTTGLWKQASGSMSYSSGAVEKFRMTGSGMLATSTPFESLYSAGAGNYNFFCFNCSSLYYCLIANGAYWGSSFKFLTPGGDVFSANYVDRSTPSGVASPYPLPFPSTAPAAGTYEERQAAGTPALWQPSGHGGYFTFSTGSLTSISANEIVGSGKTVVAQSIANIEAAATLFSCAGNPTIKLYDCGTSAGTCTSGNTEMASVTLTAASTITDGTISVATIAAGHYWAWEVTAGTCVSLDASGTAAR